MITFNNVSFKYKNSKEIINNISFDIQSGERICISGPSGSGKTTLLRLIMGLEKPKKGNIERKENITFSVSFQEDRLIPIKNANQNVALFSNTEKASEILCKLGLCEEQEKLPEELSGGMKRRVSLARALAHSSDLLILDEAFTGLDSDTKKLCIECIEEYLNGRTLIMITHDKEEATALGCRIISI